MHNPNCDGSHCQRPDGEVRLLPYGGGSEHGGGNIICCFACYCHELQFRRERNRQLAPDIAYPLPTWGSLKVLEPEARMKLIIDIPDADAEVFKRNFQRWQQSGAQLYGSLCRGILDRCKQEYIPTNGTPEKTPAEKLIESCNGCIETAQAVLVAEMAESATAAALLLEQLHRHGIQPGTLAAVQYLMELREIV